MTEVKLKVPVRMSLVEDIEAARGTPGAVEYTGNGLWYVCPCSCGHEGFLSTYPVGKLKTPSPSWSIDTGLFDRPTLHPSINHTGHWHGWLVRGYFVQEPKDAPQ